MWEDHSAATFRVRKALVPECILFADAPDVSKDRKRGRERGDTEGVGFSCECRALFAR